MIKTTPLSERVDEFGNRKAVQHNENDQLNENRVKNILWETQSIQLHQYAKYSPIDYWMEKNGQVIGMAELKTSFLENNQWAYLNVRKYTNLLVAASGFNCKAYFINQRLDGSIYIIDLDKVQGKTIIVDRGLKGKNEREPVKSIHINTMYRII